MNHYHSTPQTSVIIVIMILDKDLLYIPVHYYRQFFVFIGNDFPLPKNLLSAFFF